MLGYQNPHRQVANFHIEGQRYDAVRVVNKGCQHPTFGFTDLCKLIPIINTVYTIKITQNIKFKVSIEINHNVKKTTIFNPLIHFIKFMY